MEGDDQKPMNFLHPETQIYHDLLMQKEKELSELRMEFREFKLEREVKRERRKVIVLQLQIWGKEFLNNVAPVIGVLGIGVWIVWSLFSWLFLGPDFIGKTYLEKRHMWHIDATRIDKSDNPILVAPNGLLYHINERKTVSFLPGDSQEVIVGQEVEYYVDDEDTIKEFGDLQMFVNMREKWNGQYVHLELEPWDGPDEYAGHPKTGNSDPTVAAQRLQEFHARRNEALQKREEIIAKRQAERQRLKDCINCPTDNLDAELERELNQ